MNRFSLALAPVSCAAVLAVFMTGGNAAMAQSVSAAAGAPISHPQVHGQATWDDAFLYVAFQVDDSDVLGTNTLPLSEPEKDDSVGVYVQTGDAKPDAPDANTHAMLVSAAGGFTFLAGDTDKKAFAPKPVFTIKYGVTVQGTLNRSDDTDKGYTVELGIPWSELGVSGAAIKAGAPFSIDVVVRDRSGKSFSALSPDVKTEADIDSPSKWMKLVLASSGSADPVPGAVLAPPVPVKGGRPVAPLIDGVLRSAGEWPEAGKYLFDAPVKGSGVRVAAPILKPVANIPLDNTLPPLTLTKESLASVEPLVFARYQLDYQGDGRKPAPFMGTIDPHTGRFLLMDQPSFGAGPWFSSDRPSWHRGLLYSLRRAGVDSALVSIGGPDAPTGLGDGKALLVLVEALREMTQAGLLTPKISLCLDTTQLSADGSPTDVSTPEGQARVYTAIRRFFATVPPQYRTRVTLPVAAGGVPAFPIFLSDGAALTGKDGDAWTEAIRKSFAEEFGPQTGGTTLLFVGGPGFDATKSTGLISAGVPLTDGGITSGGSLPTAVIQAGLDTADGHLTPRKDGDTYKKNWESALAAKTKWYVLDSWNDFSRGTELVASRQFGERYLDLTRIYTVQIGNLDGIDLRWRDNNVPRRMRVGQTAPVLVSIENGGGKALRPEDGYVLTYRWRQGDKIVAEAPLRNRLDTPFLPTQNKSFLLGLSALMLDGSDKLAPLPAGDYTLEVDFLKLTDPTDISGKGQYLAETGVAPLIVPVTLYSDDEPRAEIQTTTTPALLVTGGTYPINVSVRWMGGDDLAPSTAAITWQLLTADGKTLAATGSTPIIDTLPSGVPVTVMANMHLNDTSGVPVPPAYPELPAGRGNPGGGYRLRWLLTRTDSTDNVPGELDEQVAIYDGVDEARIPFPDQIPDTVEANSTFTLPVTVVNRGDQTWKKSEFVIGAHWFYSDGVEAIWHPGVTLPLPRDVAPGEEIAVKLPVHSPENDGAYILVPDIARVPDDYLSTHPVTRIGDISPVAIRVTGGRLTFVNLAKTFNVIGVTSEAKPTDGDLDDKGGTFPAESFPPDFYGVNAPEDPTSRRPDPTTGNLPKLLPAPAYPSGYYTDVSFSARRISFRYGSHDAGAKNVVACAGQTIDVSKGNYVGVHLAATATGGQAEDVVLKLNYADKTSEKVPVSIRDWNTPLATTNDVAAAITPYKRTAKGDVAGACLLRHIIVPVNVGKELVSVTLPDDIKVKVFAMTLDR